MEISALHKLFLQTKSVSTDSRKIGSNSIYFALSGERFNGNDFAIDALNNGALYAVVDAIKHKDHPGCIYVADALKALQALGTYHRNFCKAKVISLTGSNGKTTSKELIQAVMQQKFKTVATKGNLNNHIGVPLTLLSMTPETEMGIVEMGANHQQEIAFLSSICEPDFGYITNFGKAHLDGFGGVEGVIKGKCELYDFLRAHHKMAFVNSSDALQIEKTAAISRVLFDSERIQYLEVNPFIKLSLDGNVIQTQLIGNYNFQNIAAAITMGLHFGVATAAIIQAIEGYVSQNNRSQIVKTINNTLFLDAYNANPSSMKVALENFAALSGSHKIVILGDMFELGDDSAQEHQAIADLATSLAFERIFLVGKNFHAVASSHTTFEDFDRLKSFLSKDPLQGKTILIKGSRGMKLERVVELV